ncbi:MAG: hypothetical protein ABI277_02990 [Burkholderiaceae bacterium]
MSTLPLSHHEIVGLIEPFSRRGRHADLAASDRLERRLLFKPRDHAGDDAALPAHREVLQLDAATGGRNRLTRTLVTTEGLQSALRVEGDDPAVLLARIEAVPHALQLRSGTGYRMALDLGVDASSGRVTLTGGSARAGGLLLTMKMPTSGSRRADVVLSTAIDDTIELPDDLLAVLGRDWSRLDPWIERTIRRWSGSVRVRDDAARKLEHAAGHVAEVLAESPPQFHERFAMARWLFAFRRSIPMLVCVALIVGALFFTRAGLSQDSVVRMLIFNAPPLMLVAFFCMRELPRIEWPRRPRRWTAAAWRPASIG